MIKYLHIIICLWTVRAWWSFVSYDCACKSFCLSSVLVCLSVENSPPGQNWSTNPELFSIPHTTPTASSSICALERNRPLVFWLCLALCSGQKCGWQNCVDMGHWAVRYWRRELERTCHRAGEGRRQRPPKTQKTRTVSIASVKPPGVFI